MKKAYELRAAGQSGTPELLVYGDIGESWWGESVTAKAVVDQLQALAAPRILVRINSYGGSVSDGLAIYNALRQHPAEIIVRIDGVAVSIASLIAMAGDRVEIAENALIMVHAPWGTAAGNAREHREYADVLDKHAAAMVASYVRKSGKSHDEIMGLLTDGQDHWFTADEAIAFGLADELVEDLTIAAALPRDRYPLPAAIAAAYRHEDLTMPSPTAAPATPAGATNQTALEQRAAARERERIAARNRDISAAFALFMEREGVAPLCARLMGDPEVTVDQARAELLAHLGHGQAPLAAGGRVETHAAAGDIRYGENGHHAEFAAAAQDALLARAGVRVTNPHPAAQDLRGMSLLNMAERLLSQRGRTLNSGNPNALVKAALSTSDFPALLANTAHKALMLGYEDEPASHRLWTRETEAQDFKPVSRVAVSSAPALLEKPEGGEYKAGSLSERAESYVLKTYGRMLVITREAIINDDLGGFTRIPQAFGQSAARLEADKVYELLTSNPAMSDAIALFHADHGNLLTGAELSTSSLGAARAAMRKQTAHGGEGFLNIVPAYLLVPAALETVAEQIIASLVDRDQMNDTQNPAWIRRLQLVVDPRLDAVSETGWYLAASPNQVDTVEVAHLAGQRGVFVDDETEFGTDNFRIKARLDFATQAVDWVGLVQNPGQG